MLEPDTSVSLELTNPPVQDSTADIVSLFFKRILAICLSLTLAILAPLSVWSQEDYAVVKDGVITFYYDNNKASRDGTIYNVTMELANGYPSWLNDSFKTAVFDDSFSNFKQKNFCETLAELF